MSNKSLLKRIWREHTKKHIGALVGVVALSVVIAALEAYSVSLLKPVFDEGFIPRNYNILLFLCTQIAVVYFSKGWLHFFHATILARISTKTVQSIQRAIFDHLLSLDMAFFSRIHSGQLLSRIVSECNAIANIAINSITTVSKDLITCVSMFALMIYSSWQMMIVIAIFLPIGSFAIKKIRKRAKMIAEDTTSLMASFVSKISDSMQSIKIIKAYNMENAEQKNIKNILDKQYKLAIKNAKNSAYITPVIESLTGFILIGIIILGGYQITRGDLTTGSFVVFLGAWVSVYRPLKSLMDFRVQLQIALVSAERVYHIIDTAPTVQDSPNAKEIKTIKGDISFKAVSFEYESGKRVLNGIDLFIEHGKTIALVGTSGGGKTTLISLVPRFYDVTSGAIEIDGINIKDITQKSLRDHIAYVSQDIIVFDDTIANNIAYGKGENTLATQDEIISAATSANAHQFICNMNEGYNTIIGEKGIKLSGGQKQRISIARAIIKNAPILLLDEATSALDTQSEYEVQKALDNLMKTRTTIVIAHRLSTIINADIICVINNGVITEQGTHEELIRKNGEYSKLYDMQFKNNDVIASAAKQ